MIKTPYPYQLNITTKMLFRLIITLAVLITLHSCNDNDTTTLNHANSNNKNNNSSSLSPKVLWKTKIKNGKLKLLFSKENIHYFYLESTSPSRTNLYITAINFKNGNKLYVKRDNKFQLGNALLRGNILYYSSKNVFKGFHLLNGKGILNFGRGSYLTLSKKNHSQYPIILLNSPSKHNENFDSLISYDLNKHQMLWQKPYNNEKIYETVTHLFFINNNKNLVIINKINGKRLTAFDTITKKIRQNLSILTVENNNIYLKTDNLFLNLDFQKEQIAWQSPINKGHTDFISSTQKYILIKAADKVYAFRKSTGQIIWKKQYHGNVFKILSPNQIIFYTLDKLMIVNLHSGQLIREINHPGTRHYPISRKNRYFYFKYQGNGQYLLKKISLLKKPLEVIYKLNDNGTDHYTSNSLNLKVMNNFLILGSVSSKTDHQNQIADSSLSLKAYDLQSGIEKWRCTNIKAGYMGPPIQIDNSIIVATNKGIITSLNLETGSSNWQLQTQTDIRHYSGTLVFKLLKKKGHIIYLYYDDSIYAIDTSILSDNSTSIKEI